MTPAERSRSWRQANPERHAENNRRWHAANKERVSEQKREYYKANRERLLAEKRQHRAAHPDREADAQRRYAEANREEKRLRQREYVEANHETVLKRQRRYAKDNPEMVRMFSEVRRARKVAATVETFTYTDLLAHYTAVGYNGCVYCGGPHEHDDHIVPLSRGGAHSRENLAPACGRCNTSKGSKLLAEWLGFAESR